jgi:hypothetical protein
LSIKKYHLLYDRFGLSNGKNEMENIELPIMNIQLEFAIYLLLEIEYWVLDILFFFKRNKKLHRYFQGSSSKIPTKTVSLKTKEFK